MTTRTVYVPRLIESAEQAEALPIGTIAARGALAAVRVPEQTHDEPWRSGVLGWEHVSAIGWTALVPVEVEVEQIRETAGRRRTKTLYVTPWSTPSTAEPGGAALAEGGGSR